jgi:hypothetical protein
VHKLVGLLWIAGFFGLLAAANAQTPSPSTAGTTFDGTYAFVSATKVNETYTTRPGNRIGQCADREMPPLIIVNGQARRYSKAGLVTFEGTVGPQGELLMRSAPAPAKFGTIAGIEVMVSCRIGGDGMVRARQTSYRCNYDLIWQK